jgi:cytochrome c-type biogenesis protein CcmH/NrfG
MHLPTLQQLLLLLLLLLVALCHTTPAAVAAAAAAVAQPDAENKASLEQEASKLRIEVERQPENAMLHLQLATTLHKLNHLNPDGGRRIPEAAKAYRCGLHCAWDCVCSGVSSQL